jgi:hypothetical protein
LLHFLIWNFGECQSLIFSMRAVLFAQLILIRTAAINLNHATHEVLLLNFGFWIEKPSPVPGKFNNPQSPIENPLFRSAVPG